MLPIEIAPVSDVAPCENATMSNSPQAHGRVEASRVCFFVSPLGEDGSPERERSNDVMKYIIEEGLDPLGYRVTRADLTNKAGDITEQIVSELLNADLVVADLSDHNPNVFYEVALRHAFGKPIIHMIHKGQRIPFDIAQQRTVFYDNKNLTSVYAARASIHAAAKEIIEGGEGYKVVSPVTRAVDTDQLRQSGDPERLAIADIKDQLSLLRAELHELSKGPTSVRRLVGDHRAWLLREQSDGSFSSSPEDVSAQSSNHIRVWNRISPVDDDPYDPPSDVSDSDEDRER